MGNTKADIREIILLATAFERLGRFVNTFLVATSSRNLPQALKVRRVQIRKTQSKLVSGLAVESSLAPQLEHVHRGLKM